MRVLAFAASLRQGSLNRKLIELAATLTRAEGVEVDLAHFSEFEMPLYNGDLEPKVGWPPGVAEMTKRMDAADALIIASPEYNYSIAGVLKNAIDWVSRIRPMPWRGKSVYLMSASPSPMGGIRGLWQTRIPLEGCGSLVFPDMFALPYAHLAFDEQGKLKDKANFERLQRELRGFLRLAEAVIPVCERPPDREGVLRRDQINAALEEQSELQPGSPAAKA
jgi:NAD(P)H-dependent FMN reductase